MTKVYNALRQAEAVRQQRIESPVSTDALFPPESKPEAAPHQAGRGTDLARLRDIVFGGLLGDFEQSVARIEGRIAAEEASLRTELSKFEQRLEDRLVEVDTRSCQSQATLRQRILSESNSQSDSIKERSADAVRRVNDGLRELRGGKLAGSEFSSFLRKLAAHIEGESNA